MPAWSGEGRWSDDVSQERANKDYRMDRRTQSLQKEIEELEAQLERLFRQPGLMPARREELMERVRMLKSRVNGGDGSSEHGP